MSLYVDVKGNPCVSVSGGLDSFCWHLSCQKGWLSASPSCPLKHAPEVGRKGPVIIFSRCQDCWVSSREWP